MCRARLTGDAAFQMPIRARQLNSPTVEETAYGCCAGMYAVVETGRCCGVFTKVAFRPPSAPQPTRWIWMMAVGGGGDGRWLVSPARVGNRVGTEEEASDKASRFVFRATSR